LDDRSCSAVKSSICIFVKEKNAFSELEIIAEQPIKIIDISPQTVAVSISAGFRLFTIDNTINSVWDGGSPVILSKIG
jgi:hypothetical protein